MRGNFLLLLVFGAGLVLAEPVDSGDMKPERTVTGRAITSTHDPAVRIEFNKGFGYVGGERFVLYRTADCELHLFVDANDKGNVRRMYWIQFEGYLPGNNDTYKYKSQEHATIGGLEFVLDSAPRSYVDYQPATSRVGRRARNGAAAEQGLSSARERAVVENGPPNRRVQAPRVDDHLRGGPRAAPPHRWRLRQWGQSGQLMASSCERIA